MQYIYKVVRVKQTEQSLSHANSECGRLISVLSHHFERSKTKHNLKNVFLENVNSSSEKGNKPV